MTHSNSTPATTAKRNSWEDSKRAWLSPSSGWELDGSKPLSNLLKMATAQAHVDVLRPPIVNKLITGRIPLQTHVLYLMMLYDVYDAMESALSIHADHPLLAATYKPSVLARTQGISEDITYLLNLPAGSDWQLHDDARAYRTSPPSALRTYVDRIRALSSDDLSVPMQSHEYVYPPPPAQSFLLLAHAYVRYMGDLNGGQQIKDSVAKAYHFDKDSDVGLRFYRFENETDGQECSPAELGKITASLRKGMDSIGEGLTPEQRASLLQEANHAFELNILLFSSFTEEGDLPSVTSSKSKNTFLSVDSPSPTPHIPSPSLEGYAKAANYMPEKRREELRVASKLQHEHAFSSSTFHAEAQVPPRTDMTTFGKTVLLLLMLLGLYLSRETLQKMLM